MVTLIRLEAEDFTLDGVVAALNAAEEPVMALQKDEAKGHVALNTRVTDEHYERVEGKAGTYFKGRRVLRFTGRAAWDDNSDIDKPQPRLAASLPMPGVTATAPSSTNVWMVPRAGA